MKKQPEKTAQTKQSMIDAFWVIAKKRGLNNVTISEITKYADLNRGTFYVYFSDMNDLLAQAEDEIIEDLRSKVWSVFEDKNFADFQAVSAKVIEVFGEYDDNLFLLLGKDGDPQFLDHVRKEAANVFNAVMKQEKENPYQDYIIAYVTSAFTGLLQFWHETGKEISLAELSGLAHRMTLHVMLGLKEQSEH
ncbi:MAG: TetR/AcrR family transcriptional regulator [Clostridia bacterium]|nr:TetR/AcrR family transcriptional regulator [Clostridia bacterium]